MSYNLSELQLLQLEGIFSKEQANIYSDNKKKIF